MDERFARLSLMYGEDAVSRLSKCHVALFGVGGVGGAVCEALVRGGVGALTLIDGDAVDISNINRQIIATERSIGRAKVEIAAERVAQINPACEVRPLRLFFTPESGEPDFSQFDYVIDAIDTVTAKLEIIARAKAAGVPVISCMGTGNKQNPMGFIVADIAKTSVCPLARVMRLECRKRGLTDVKCVYSKEEPSGNLQRIPASNSFTPPAAGLLLAAEVLKDLMKTER